MIFLYHLEYEDGDGVRECNSSCTSNISVNEDHLSSTSSPDIINNPEPVLDTSCISKQQHSVNVANCYLNELYREHQLDYVQTLDNTDLDISSAQVEYFDELGRLRVFADITTESTNNANFTFSKNEQSGNSFEIKGTFYILFWHLSMFCFRHKNNHF